MVRSALLYELMATFRVTACTRTTFVWMTGSQSRLCTPQNLGNYKISCTQSTSRGKEEEGEGGGGGGGGENGEGERGGGGRGREGEGRGREGKERMGRGRE